MSLRPTYIDLKPLSHDARRADCPTPGDIPSPRTGDVPPALSPLDAFALQSRLLAKRLDGDQANGKRISRIPPLMIAKELAKPRPGYARSASGSSEESKTQVAEAGMVAPVEGNQHLTARTFRPQSIHPTILYGDATSRLSAMSQSSNGQLSDTVFDGTAFGPVDYFSTPRAPSSDLLQRSTDNQKALASLSAGSKTSFELPRHFHQVQTSLLVDSIARMNNASLAPPQSPAAPRSPLSGSSIRSYLGDSGDDTDASSIGAFSDLKLSRKASTDSGSKRNQSQLSPPFSQHARSSSINSECSVGVTKLQKSTLNFSRPLSRVSQLSPELRPSLDIPSNSHQVVSASMFSRRPSFHALSQADLPVSHDRVDTIVIPISGNIADSPISEDGEEFLNSHHYNGLPAPSYIYSKYSLPRGRMVPRESLIFPEASRHRFEWELAGERSNLAPSTPAKQKAPSSRLSTPQGTMGKEPRPQTSDGITRDPRLSADESRLLFPKTHRPRHSANSPSTTSGNTVKSPFERTYKSRSVSMTPEQHLERGIEAHEKGGRDAESTYHLRLAAKAGLPTAMLLYALAYRHGWGVRPNKAEAVKWLKMAVDSSSLEVVDDECNEQPVQPGDVIERKTRKAQFALTIYELGISYMNGWGTQQDKALALRCFEVAGNWGDADALAEAGFCYAQGLGCKKNLKKAAGYYRAGEAKGISMAGNSWIYKEKYLDDDGRRRPGKDRPETKPGDKSRTRTIFGRKKMDAT